MKDNQSEHSMGEQIMDALSDALQSGDFNNLNRLVSQSVTNALNEVGKHISFFDDENTVEQARRQAQERAQHQRQSQTYRQTQEAHEQRNQKQTYQQSQSQAWQRGQAQTSGRTQEQPWQQGQNQTYSRTRPNGQEQPYYQTQNSARDQHQERRQMHQSAATARQQSDFSRSTPLSSSWQQAPKVPRRAGSTAVLPFQFKKVGKVSNVLYQVFGGIGLGITILTTFIYLLFLLAGEATSIASWIISLLFLALFTGMIRLGIGQRRRLKLAERYAGLCGRNLFGEIEYLARNTGRKTRRVVRDLKKMISLGIFPEGHLDEKNTCFMLSDGIYQQYLDAENGRKIREEELSRLKDEENSRKLKEEEKNRRLQEETGNNLHSEAKNQNASDAKSGHSPISPEQESELNAMIAEGMECVRKLRLLNDKIPGEVISAKLFRLENLLKELFNSVREHPDQMHRMHKLMSYYLPTTLKLVEAYEEFDRVSVPGEDILAAKAEIENTLDTINQAFTELLNNLFQDAVLDATTDAQVLKTMLAREGLMNDMDFTTEKNG